MNTPAFHWPSVYADLLQRLRQNGLENWAGRLESQLERRFEQNLHGDMARWLAALQRMPVFDDVRAKLDQGTLTLETTGDLEPNKSEALEEALRGLMPWRKGPFSYFDIFIDTEWRSDWKWERVAPSLSDLTGRRVLDVGCGSGYHLWRMHAAGAREVIGIDPGLLFLFQFLSFKNYLDNPRVDFLPIKLEDMPAGLQAFDTTFSMGVLYHRRSPLDHLLELKDTLRPGGELVLETLITEGPEGYSLMPSDRYAQMRNVWFLPSVPTLVRWLERTGFSNIKVVDVSATTTEEQRSTDWMRFNSLPDFLDPADASLTVEGYPAPVRATLIATK